jgi:hypothetical protein
MKQSLIMRRGMAMVVVVAAVALAAVLGYAMLSGSALQAQAGANAAQSAAADALAEAGVNLAMYYLLHPSRAPALNGEGFWPGQSNLSLGQGTDGGFDISVSRTAPNVYEVTSTGRSGAGVSGLSRTNRTRVRVNSGFEVKHALSVHGDVTIYRGTRIQGDLQSNGQLVVKTYGRVEGRATVPIIPIVELLGLLGSYSLRSDMMIPRASDINDFRTYVYDGVTYQAKQITGPLSNILLGPTEDNPGGVFWSDGNVQLNGGVWIEGTLIVRNGSLVVQSGSNTIRPQRRFPALVVDQHMDLVTGADGLTAHGLCWIGGSVRRPGGSGNRGNLIIRGAFVMGGTGTLAPNDQGTIHVEYVADNVFVPDFSSNVAQVPESVTIMNWNF